MIKTKWIAGLMIFAFCFILTSEMTQNYFTDFTENAYYLNVDLDNRDQLYHVMKQISEQNQTPVFSVRKEYLSNRAVRITVYIENNKYDLFRNIYDLSPGIYPSMFSGTTEIQFKDFSEIRQNYDVERFYFLSASMEQMDNIYHQISRYFHTSYVRKENSSGLNQILNVLWFLPLMFLLLLTWFAVQFERKKDFLRISLGASKAIIILKAVMADLIIFAIEFVSVYLLIDRFIYIRYHIASIRQLFAVFLLLNSLIHLTLLRFQYKEIIYGANLNLKLLSNCYIVKSVVLILALCSVSINIYLIGNQTRYLKYRQIISSHQTESFLSIQLDMNAYRRIISAETDMQTLSEPPEDTAYSIAVKQILSDQIAKDRVVFSCLYGETGNSGAEICYMNDSTFIVSDQLRNMLDPKADFSFMYPSGLMPESEAEIEAEKVIESVFGLEVKRIQCHLIPYSCKAKVLFLDTNRTCGFDICVSPVVLFCNTASTHLREAIETSEQIDNALFQQAVFQLDDSETESLKDLYHLNECRMTSASEQFEALQNNMLHIVLLNIVVSILMIILNLSIGSAIIRLQYIINAKRLSIMKVLGYSVLRMNAPIFLLNLFSVIISLITNLILAVMYHKTNWWLILLIGVIFIVADTITSLLHIQKLERTNTPKILKGGSL